MREEWRPVQGYEGRYEVSNLGRVRSIDRFYTDAIGVTQRYTGRVLRPVKAGAGYDTVVLSAKGVQRRVYVHRLVAAAFLEPQDGRREVNHMNGNKTDNRAANLEYVTPAENKSHASRMGLLAVGSRNTQTKLKAEDVIEIRRLLAEGEYQRVIASKYGVCQTTIGDIHRSVTWRHVAV